MLEVNREMSYYATVCTFRKGGQEGVECVCVCVRERVWWSICFVFSFLVFVCFVCFEFAVRSSSLLLVLIFFPAMTRGTTARKCASYTLQLLLFCLFRTHVTSALHTPSNVLVMFNGRSILDGVDEHQGRKKKKRKWAGRCNTK